jgi:hypothetical protein
MRLSYPIFRLQNYPQATGTRPIIRRPVNWALGAKGAGIQGMVVHRHSHAGSRAKQKLTHAPLQEVHEALRLGV